MIRSLTLLVWTAALLAACGGDDNSDWVGPPGPDAARLPDAPAPGDCSLDPTLPFDDLGDILQLESADRSSCVWMSRRNDCQADICLATPFTILEARLGHDGSVVEQDDSSSMTWTETHHNWNDSAEIDIDGTRYSLQLIFGSTLRYELTATRIFGGAVQWGPVDLLPYNASF